MKKIAAVTIFFIVFVLGGMLYYYEGTLPVNKKSTTSKIFVIRRGESISSIVKRLHNEELIRNRIVFYILIKKLGIASNIQAGDFRLSPAMSASEIAKNLTKGTLDVWITIIEGLRKEEIAQIVAKEFSIPEIEFIKLAQEGYLFPDTYLIPREATAGAIIDIMKQNFYNKYTSILRSQAQKRGLSDKEVIILASIVEKEVKTDGDRAQVASIILKRWKANWPLQIDATVQYALGYQPTTKTWWKKNLTVSDLKIDSPYNTYLHLGIPPEPISNPGLSSLKAVAEADVNTPYWFYISSKDGSKIYYATTIEEHQENIGKYLR